MRKIGVLGALIGMCLAGATLHADTRTGNANLRTIQGWSFSPTGPVDIVLTWTKGAVDLDMILFCEAGVVGVDIGVVDRLATIQADPFGGPCVLGVTAFRGSSAYRVHFRQGANLVSRSAGREPRALASNDPDGPQGAGHIGEPAKPLPNDTDRLFFEAERTLWNLHQRKELTLQSAP